MQFMQLWKYQSKTEGTIKYRLLQKHFTDQITCYSHVVSLSPAMEKIPEADILNSVETQLRNVILLVSLLLYTLGYTEGCTWLMTKSLCCRILKNYSKT